MPTYEYECGTCGGHFEYFHSMSEKKEACEKCGGPLTKLLSAGSGLIFKGSGFYITDYKPKSGSEGTAAGSTGGVSPKGESPKSESKADSNPSKTEAKPAAKSTESK